MLQIVQPNQQTSGFGGSSKVRTVAVGENSIEALPVDLLSEHAQRMIEIQELLKLSKDGIGFSRFFLADFFGQVASDSPSRSASY